MEQTQTAVRKPWLAAAIGLLFSPFIGALYLNRGRLALKYFAANLVLLCLPYLLAQIGISPVKPGTSAEVLSWMLHFGGAYHCFRIAQGREIGPLKWYAPLYVSLLVFGIGPVLAAVIIRTFLFQPFNIPSGAMIPTLKVGDVMFVSKYAYGYNRYSFPFSLAVISGRVFAASPERGDIVVFKFPRDNKTDYVKRVIGLPGDVVQMRHGRLFINGSLVERELIDDFVYRDADGSLLRLKQYKETLPGGKVHNILEEDDNRRFDNTPEYLVPPGHYFVMGDNRDYSADSRADVGFVPEENLVGRYALTVWNGVNHQYKFERVD